MRQFVFRVTAFIGLFGFLLLMSMILPASPNGKNYYLFSKKMKDSLMDNEKSPRIVFIGGSNLVFGLNSQLIAQELPFQPINGGLTATVGLKYMLDNVEPRIKEGDLVVVIPEYQHYFGKFAFGQNDLAILLYDIDPTGFTTLNLKQWMNLLKSSPKYLFSKYNPEQYISVDKESIYGMQIFNAYGDSDFHWDMEPRDFEPSSGFSTKLNKQMIKGLQEFERKANEKGAEVLISFPGFQSTSFENNRQTIEVLDSVLKTSGLSIVGTPERYKIPDSLMFETPYHMIRPGVERRTRLLIDDIKEHLSQ